MFTGDFCQGQTYYVINNISKDGIISTREIVFDHHDINFKKIQEVIVTNTGREYSPWRVFETRQDAINDYLKDQTEMINKLKHENDKLLKTVEKNKNKIEKMKLQIEQIKEKN